MSETVMLTSNPYDPKQGERRGGTVGFPLPGVGLRVRDDKGQPLPAGEIGHIEVKGPNVFKGYWRMPEKTADDFTTDLWFKTGDVGKIGSRRLRHHRRPQQGPDHQRRLQRLPGRGRRLHQRDAGRGRIGGDRRAAMPTSARRWSRWWCRKPGAALDGAAIVAELKTQIANFKVPKAGVRGRRPAAQRHGQGAEEPAARAAQGAVHRMSEPTPPDASDRCPRCGGGFHCGMNDAAPCACTAHHARRGHAGRSCASATAAACACAACGRWPRARRPEKPCATARRLRRQCGAWSLSRRPR